MAPTVWAFYGIYFSMGSRQLFHTTHKAKLLILESLRATNFPSFFPSKCALLAPGQKTAFEITCVK